MKDPLIIRRRLIGEEDLGVIRQLIAQEGGQGRSHISNRLCEIWDWRQANGRYRQIACRDLLRKLEARGLIELPPRLCGVRQPGYQPRVQLPDLLDRIPLQGALGRLGDQIQVGLVQGRTQGELYKGLIEAYHYLGYQHPSGAQLKYIACYQDRPIACLSFGPAAWKVAPRDQFIGWSAAQREQQLPWVVNNERFLILPWVQVRFLASFLLGQCVRRVRQDWQGVYNHDLALAETFIQTERFAGHCYAAANWICVGHTQGRGRNDRLKQWAQPIKTIWLYPLRRDFRHILCA